jgi:non-heme chloroperoxidase
MKDQFFFSGRTETSKKSMQFAKSNEVLIIIHYGYDTSRGKHISSCRRYRWQWQARFFVHGWPLDLKMFEYQFITLKENGYRCIGLDLRGFGMSAKPWQDYNYDVFADDIQKVMNELKLEQKFAIVGFSMGGGIVMHYVAKYYPNTLSHVVFMGAAAPSLTKRDGYPHGQDRAFCDQIITRLMQNRPKMISDFGNMLFHNPESQGPEMANWLFAQSMAAAPYATLTCAKSLRDEDLRNDMQMISDRNLPVAVFHGLHDKVCPFDLAKVMNNGIEGSKLVQFNESGHALNIEEKEKTNEELMKFIT